MLTSGPRNFCRAAIGMIAAGFMFATLSAGSAQAATVDEFLANPAQVLAQYPNGGADLISLIRDVATSHPEALASITNLISGASSDQQSAIGSGLGQAAAAVAATDPAYATQIQAAVAASGSSNVQTAYAGATGNVSIAATGPGGGVGGGSGGPAGGFSGSFGSGGSNSGTGGTTGSNSSQNSGNTFTGGGGGTTSSGSVSPRG